jgi:hypothetical protein
MLMSLLTVLLAIACNNNGLSVKCFVHVCATEVAGHCQ